MAVKFSNKKSYDFFSELVSSRKLANEQHNIILRFGMYYNTYISILQIYNKFLVL